MKEFDRRKHASILAWSRESSLEISVYKLNFLKLKIKAKYLMSGEGMKTDCFDWLII